MIKVKSQLDHIRIKSGYSITELAQAVGVSQQFISAIMKGVYAPSPKTAKKICDILEVEFDEVFEIVEG